MPRRFVVSRRRSQTECERASWSWALSVIRLRVHRRGSVWHDTASGAGRLLGVVPAFRCWGLAFDGPVRCMHGHLKRFASTVLLTSPLAQLSTATARRCGTPRREVGHHATGSSHTWAQPAPLGGVPLGDRVIIIAPSYLPLVNISLAKGVQETP